MAVINIRTRARLTRRPFARPAAGSGTSPARNDGTRKPRHILLTAVAGVIAAAGVLAGCGTAATAGAGGAASQAHPAKASLTIKVTDKANGKVSHWTLRCDPPGGTSPDPAAACKTLFSTKDAFDPRKHLVMCPMIMVSGKQIVVDGVWFGKQVHRVIIDGGCDLSIFNNLAKNFNAKIFN